MGGIYENGIYVVKDIKKARYWYKLAAEQGDEDAVKALKRLDSTGNTPATTKK
jgi:TPR repeat protein